MSSLFDFFRHIDTHLDTITADYGIATYFILFAIVFCETGLVILPLLPGDSLLFAAGAIASRGALNPHLLVVILMVSAIVGDTVNYAVGHFFGPRILARPRWFLKPSHLEQTEKFYEKYGAKAVVFARFVPIVRTIAPFMAGVGTMNYGRFFLYNVIGGVCWVVLFVYAGYFFGEVRFIKSNFSLVILAIIVLSLIPPLLEVWKARKVSAPPAPQNV